MQADENFNVKPTAKIVWLGGKPSVETFTKSKKGNTWEMMTLSFHSKKETFSIQTNKKEIKVAVSNGFLQIVSLQFPGKKKMTASELLNGMTFSDEALVL